MLFELPVWKLYSVHQGTYQTNIRIESLGITLDETSIYCFRKEDLYLFLKDAFCIEEDKHYEMLTRVGQEKGPQTCLEVFIDRAESLIAKDPNGLYLKPYFIVTPIKLEWMFSKSKNIIRVCLIEGQLE